LSTRGALLVKTDDLSLRKDDAGTPYPDDSVHFGTSGTWKLGQRFADAIADAIDRREGLVPQVISLGPQAHVTVYLPDAQRANGKAVVICPGGGYGGICTNTEGTPIAQHLVQRGIAALVLKYRLPHGQHDLPGSDARAAIGLARRHAQDWNLDPAKIGIWGFSAGGHLAATVGTLARGDERANFQILFYPVISMQDDVTHRGSRRNLLGEQPSRELSDRYSLELQVSGQTAPAFLLHAASDTVVDPRNSLRYYEALVREKVPAVMHFYQHGGHGPGAFQQNPSWELALDHWLSEQ
jgi:acetyl esterase/lipase